MFCKRENEKKMIKEKKNFLNLNHGHTMCNVRIRDVSIFRP